VPVRIVEWSVNGAGDCLAGVVQTELQAETKQGSMYVYELNEAPAEVCGRSFLFLEKTVAGWIVCGAQLLGVIHAMDCF
jgi:hypothetical protein